MLVATCSEKVNVEVIQSITKTIILPSPRLRTHEKNISEPPPTQNGTVSL